MIQKKICLLGDFAVGKTSLVRQFIEGRFDDRYLSTIGVKISRRTITRPDSELKLLIWDLAGGDDFTTVTAGYLRGSSGALIVCDLTRPVTLLQLENYVEQLHQLNLYIPIVFAANKVDLKQERKISDDQLNQVLARWSSPFIFTSAKTGEGVEEAFSRLAQQIEQTSS